MSDFIKVIAQVEKESLQICVLNHASCGCSFYVIWVGLCDVVCSGGRGGGRGGGGRRDNYRDGGGHGPNRNQGGGSRSRPY